MYRKTKVFIFRNGGKVKPAEKWNLNGQPLVIVDKFVYLGGIELSLINILYVFQHSVFVTILKIAGFRLHLYEIAIIST